jgi:Cu(I)/Ag(I) efflux system membrane fusion protein
MRLVKVTSAAVAGNKLAFNDTQMILANITTAVAHNGSMAETKVLNGVLKADERKTAVISSPAAGRIERLFIKETGQFIRQGEPLYVLYSETLLALRQEYFMALEQYDAHEGKQNDRSYVDAAKRKLLLYGLTEQQLAGMTGKTTLQPAITLLAPASGIVTDVLASEGQYVAEGGGLYRLSDMRSLWVEAEVYPNEISHAKKGDAMRVRIDGFEESVIDATVTFISPAYKGNTQVAVVRGQIANEALRYQPGQHAQVILTRSAREGISLPADAVIRSGDGSHVYVQSGKNTFEPRMVKTGVEGSGRIEITEGVEEGDTVAVTGAYLLYSELVLKKGSNPMAGHAH